MLIGMIVYQRGSDFCAFRMIGRVPEIPVFAREVFSISEEGGDLDHRGITDRLLAKAEARVRGIDHVSQLD